MLVFKVFNYITLLRAQCAYCVEYDGTSKCFIVLFTSVPTTYFSIFYDLMMALLCCNCCYKDFVSFGGFGFAANVCCFH